MNSHTHTHFFLKQWKFRKRETNSYTNCIIFNPHAECCFMPCKIAAKNLSIRRNQWFYFRDIRIILFVPFSFSLSHWKFPLNCVYCCPFIDIDNGWSEWKGIEFFYIYIFINKWVHVSVHFGGDFSYLLLLLSRRMRGWRGEGEREGEKVIIFLFIHRVNHHFTIYLSMLFAFITTSDSLIH